MPWGFDNFSDAYARWVSKSITCNEEGSSQTADRAPPSVTKAACASDLKDNEDAIKIIGEAVKRPATSPRQAGFTHCA